MHTAQGARLHSSRAKQILPAAACSLPPSPISALQSGRPAAVVDGASTLGESHMTMATADRICTGIVRHPPRSSALRVCSSRRRHTHGVGFAGPIAAAGDMLARWRVESQGYACQNCKTSRGERAATSKATARREPDKKCATRDSSHDAAHDAAHDATRVASRDAAARDRRGTSRCTRRPPPAQQGRGGAAPRPPRT